ncbi:MAG: hypothetical protein J0H98_08180 [Solirubrobacterales bacterium]|nr:hypothetical protein [Solirubrobacterales bacterium]
MSAGYNVGTIEAMLKGNLDDTDFKKFDAAVDKAKASTKSLADSQGKAASEMRRSGKSYDEIAKKLGVTEDETKALIRRNEELQREQRKSTETTDRQGKATGRTADTMKRGIRYAVGLATAYLGIAEAKKAIDTTLDYNLAVQGLNRNLGISIATASRWATVAKARNIDNKAMVMSFTTLSKQIEKAKDGEESALDVFKELGITQKDLTEGGQSFEAQVLKIANAFGEAEGGTQRQAVAQQLLGRGYQTILPLFTAGEKSLKEQMHWADEFGTVLSTKTSDGLFDVVKEQRRSEAAMLGLQFSFTKVAAPAVEALNEEFQTFIKTLNDPDISDEVKIRRIGDQIERIIDRVLDVLEDAAPDIAERSGRIGIAIAKGIVQTFLHSNWLGRLAVGAWLIHAFGGWGALARLGGRAGLSIGRALATRFLAIMGVEMAAEGAFGQLMNTRFRRMIPFFKRWGGQLGLAAGIAFVTLGLASPDVRKQVFTFGTKLGEWLTNGLIDAVNFGIRTINASFDKANILGKLGVDAPEIGEIGHVKVHKGQIDKTMDDWGIAPLEKSTPVPGYRRWYDQNSKKKRRRSGDYSTEVTGEVGDGNDEITQSFDDMGDDVVKSTDKTQEKVVKDFKTIRDKATDHQRKLQGNLRDSWRRIDQDHADRVRDMDQTTRKRFGNMRETVSKRGRDMVDSMSETMGGLLNAVNGGFGSIANQTNRALKAFGVQPVAFGVQAGKAEKKAEGGFLSGVGLQDTVPVWAAPGEAFVNRHQQPEIEQALAVSKAMGIGTYGSLDELFAGVTTPHYMAQGGIVPVPGYPGERINSRVLGPALAFLKKWNLFLTDAYGPGHASPEHTVAGTAIDVVPGAGGSWSKVAQAAYEAVRIGWTPVGYDGTHGTEAWSGHGPPSMAGGNAHAHITLLTMAELAAGLNPGGVVAANIRRQVLTGPDGALKSGGQGALDKVRKAAQKYINGKMSTAGAGFGGVEVSGDYQAMGRQMMLQMFPASEWPALKELWTRESGWNPAARNPSSGAYGIPQALPASKMGPAAQGTGPAAAKAQIAWGLNYIKERYGTPSAALAFHNSHNWYAKGGKVVTEGGKILLRGGLDHKATAAILGNSYGESGWDTESMEPGTNNGGAFGFTAPPVSYPDLERYAARQKLSPTSIKAQFQFMLHDLKGRLPGTFKKLNAQDAIPESTETFMREWERPASMSSLGKRIDAAFRASKILRKFGITANSASDKEDGPKMVFLPSGGVAPGKKRSGIWITEEQNKARIERERKERAAFRKRWLGRKKAVREGRKAIRQGAQLPRFRRSLADMPRFTDAELAETIGFHDPIAGDAFAYDRSYDILDRIDPRLGQIRDRLLGSYDMNFSLGGTSLHDRFETIDRINHAAGNRLESMRHALAKAEKRDLKAGMLTLPPRNGGVRPPRPATKRQIRDYYRQEAARRSAAIKAATAARRKQVMAPVRKYRTGQQQRFDRLSAQGEFFADIISQTRGTIAATRTAQSSQGRAFFAQGGRVGHPMTVGAPGGDLNVTVVLADPTLAALDPHIEVQIDRAGKKTASRGRAAGGRKARL